MSYAAIVAAERDICELLCLDLPKAEATRRRLPSPQGGRARVADLAWIVARDEKLVSHHVRALRAAVLAVSSRQGRMVMYELTDQAAPAVRGRRGRAG